MNNLAAEKFFQSVARDVRLTGAAGIGLLLLLAGVVTNRYRADALPLRPHPEHLAIPLALGILAYLLAAQRARLSFRASDLLLGAYLALALGVSLSVPDDPRSSAQFWLRMFLSVAVYFLSRWLISGAPPAALFRLAVEALLVFGVLEALFGTAIWFLYPFGLNLGVDEYPLGVRGPGGVLCNFSLTMHGTLWEPNVFGSTVMAVALIGATLFVSDEFRAWRKLLGVALAIMLTALALNASRGALGALAFGLGLVILVADGMPVAQKLKWALAAAALVLVVNVASLELSRVLMQLPTAPGLAERAPCAEWIAQGMPRGRAQNDSQVDPPTGPESSSNVVNRVLESQTLTSRWETYQRGWDDFLKRPLFGNGANSFGQKYTTTAHTPGWISNLFLMSLHDTGVIGTAILLVWFVVYGWTVLRAWRRGEHSAQRTLVLALTLGAFGLLVAYQVTPMLWFGFIWWYFAVLEAGSAVLSAEPSRPVATAVSSRNAPQAKNV